MGVLISSREPHKKYFILIAQTADYCNTLTNLIKRYPKLPIMDLLYGSLLDNRPGNDLIIVNITNSLRC